jgi:glutamate/tyrosine decarboxylase-like PLP-dependent enzyme
MKTHDSQNHYTETDYPLAAWFLGPRAENVSVWEELVSYIFQDYVHWRRNYFPTDPVLVSRVQRRSDRYEAWVDDLVSILDEILNELKQHFPFHSPRYIAHMLSEQSLPAFLGYFTGVLFNPNNVTEEAAPITVQLELEVGKMIAEMLGYNPKRSWAHLCSGGTIANLEALWVARMAKFVPFIVREYCEKHDVPFEIKTANGNPRPILDVDDKDLIALRSNEAIFMLRKLARYSHERKAYPYERILAEINKHLSESAYNPARRGMRDVHNRVGMDPIIFVSAAAHYSIAKAANVLGYGENAVRSVPVTRRFQIDMEKLREMILGLPESEYVAAVVGIVGTTEEGAVDPVHEIRFLRSECEKERNQSFWLHVDAAWGGYIRSLFCGLELKRLPPGSSLEDICDQYVRELRIEEKFVLDVGTKNRIRKAMEIRWANRDVYAAFLAMADADSTTIDPHKMGFVPYPAGVIAFRNGLVTELITQRAQYISDERGGIKSIDKPIEIKAVGPYILEGSKPGAAALACWLAHKAIPLEAHGHGKIARTTILNAKKLFKYLVNHRHIFKQLHEEITGEEYCVHPFTFIPFFEPDTNIVCFIARPMIWRGGKLAQNDISLEWINRLNEKIYASTSISDIKRNGVGSSAQPFFVSRTRFEEKQYSYKSISQVLRMIGVKEKDYRNRGVFVLRSTVMNPWYFAAEKAGMNYLYGFVRFLHRIAASAVEEVEREMVEAIKRAQ